MKKERKTDLEKIAKKAKSGNVTDEKKAVKDAKSLKSDIPPLKEYSVEPVIKPKDKGKKPKGATRNGRKKSTKKPPGKTDTGTIKKAEEKPKAGEKTPVPVPDRRKRGYFDWFTDGGKGEPGS